ncbi:hypothetical protein [Francisella sciaenopsi]|uniref:Pentapeptide repeat-containing protein n=1 Tax=Francisella sciaenopsi TaxID=3055034 RepID=A0ABQ6PF94_9GAMM
MNNDMSNYSIENNTLIISLSIKNNIKNINVFLDTYIDHIKKDNPNFKDITKICFYEGHLNDIFFMYHGEKYKQFEKIIFKNVCFRGRIEIEGAFSILSFNMCIFENNRYFYKDISNVFINNSTTSIGLSKFELINCNNIWISSDGKYISRIGNKPLVYDITIKDSKFLNIIENSKEIKEQHGGLDINLKNRVQIENISQEVNFKNATYFSVIVNGQIKNFNLNDSIFDEINFHNATCHKFKCSNTTIDKLNLSKSEFVAMPQFDEKTSIKHSVDIDKKTFDNLLKIENTGSLEYSRLAEFFNRNNAYMEAQQLHRHYLLAKAKESKSCGLKTWVGLYDLINGCGTSLQMPFILMLCLLYVNIGVLEFQFLKLKEGSEVLIYAINNILPMSGLFTHSKGVCLPGVILALKFTSILATLLWFLIALQIRKLLKLKD